MRSLIILLLFSFLAVTQAHADRLPELRAE